MEADGKANLQASLPAAALWATALGKSLWRCGFVKHMMFEVPTGGFDGRMYERHWSPMQIAELWGVSADKVRRLFQNEPGVLVIANATKGRRKRRYQTLRIPQHVFERVHRRLSKV
jgi:hypothetical protein